MSKIGKEIVIFIGLFLFLTLGMHMQQWISHPIEHLEHLSNSQFGLFHPLYFTALVYVVVYFIRVTFSWIKKLFMRKG
jgi:hypothetical protein